MTVRTFVEPVTVASPVNTGASNVTEKVATTVKAADFMKFVVPCEMSTKALFVAGTVIVTPAGIAPPAVEVKVEPLGHAAEPLAWKQ